MKKISVENLMSVLLKLPDDVTYLTVNAVGNIAAIDADEKYLGYIDMTDPGSFDHVDSKKA